MKRQPWLLDYVFQQLVNDPLLAQKYGQKQIDAAKEWFLNTKIQVDSNLRKDEAKFPAISIALSQGNDDDPSLGEINYEPVEEIDTAWPALSDPFDPVSFIQSSGRMTVPLAVADQVRLAEGLLVVTKGGNSYEIVDSIDETSFRLATNITDDFKGAMIKPPRPAFAVSLESTFHKESYQIGCHVNSDPAHLIWLDSIVYWCLQRYKQSLLEARGLERVSIQRSDFGQNQAFDQESGQTVLTRWLTVSGVVKQGWIKDIKPKINSVETYIGFYEEDDADEDVTGLGDDSSV